jgi:hypothetical protein
MSEDADVRNAKDAVQRMREFEQRVENHSDPFVRAGVAEMRVVREWILSHELETLEEKNETLEENKRLHARIDKKMDKAPVYYIGGSLTTLVIAVAAAVIVKFVGG